MTVKVEQPSPRPRSNKFGLGLSLRPQAFHRRALEKQNDSSSDDWYIPYNGPIEKPRLSHEFRPRDSWGDLISTYGIDGSDMNSRYDTHRGDVRLDGIDANHEQVVVGRNRALSGVSYPTMYSTGIDTNRSSGAVTRRPTVSRGAALSVSSYNTDTGGVGESPMPPQRLAHLSQNTTNSHRVSITSLFSFNGSSGKSRSSPSRSPPARASDSRRMSPPKPLSSLLRSNSYMEEKRDNSKTRGRREKAVVPVSQATAPSKTTDEAYYDSYYSTLITSKAKDKTATSNRPPDTSNQRYQIPGTRGIHRLSNSETQAFPSQPAHQLIPHPYASQSEWPSIEQSTTVRRQLPDLTTATHHQRQNRVPDNHPSVSRPHPSNQRRLRTSVSSPDLYGARVTNFSRRSSTKERTYPRDRWLAIETWCDAIVFPRPRFYVKQGDKEKRAMIITPPDTPILGTVGHLDEVKTSPDRNPLPVLPSRVLLHSKSHNDLRNSTDTGASSRPLISRSRGATLPNGARVITNMASYDTGLSVVRPRPSVQDDARSVSPVPSLAKVLEDTRQLNELRQKWQKQAINSFQNKRSRSISRTRSKSLSSGQPRTGRKEGEASKAMDLATWTFLGSQSVMPTVHQTRPSHRPSDKFGTGTTSSKSHSHSSSLIKSSSKSSKASHRAHSRNESWGHSALKYAKSTAVSLCGFSDNSLYPQDEQMAAPDSVLKGDVGVTMGQPDTDARESPSLQPGKTGDIAPDPPFDPPSHPWRVSPTPSGGYEAVGIALSTPPPPERHSPSSDNEPIDLSDHPYGQSSLTHVHKALSVTHRVRDSWRGSDYAGPHLASSNLVVQGDISDVAARHRLPPQAIIHPYAQVTSTGHQSVEEALKVHSRSGSQIPPEEKMWAQLSPGGIQEILPTDISYSPFETSPLQMKHPEHVRKTRSTMSVGEALTSAMRTRNAGKDEDHETAPVITLTKQGSDEPENDGQFAGEEKVTVLPLRLRHPYGTAIPEPAKLTPTQSDVMSDSPLQTGRSSGSSPGMHSQNSSPRMSPRPLGSVDDLDHFRDLFYRPAVLRGDSIGSVATGSITLPWDIRSHRTGSGLTSLARQLSVELEELNAKFDLLDGSLEQSPNEGMRFVLSEAGSPRQMTSSLRSTLDRENVSSLLQPSFNVPEDIDSVASSVMRQSPAESEDDTGPIRLGVVESLSTPITTNIPRPLSGHLSLVDEDLGVPEEADTTVRFRSPKAPETEEAQYAQRQPLSASLHAPSAEPTRSSYMTTSTAGSRMSNLSDFPAPPGDMDAHMRLVEAYLAIAPVDVHSLPSEGSRVSRRTTFDGDEDADDTISPP